MNKNSSLLPSQLRNFRTLPTITTGWSSSKTSWKRQQALTGSLVISHSYPKYNSCLKIIFKRIWSPKQNNMIIYPLHSILQYCRRRLKMIFSFRNWKPKLISRRNSKRSIKAQRSFVMNGMSSDPSFKRLPKRHKSFRQPLKIWKSNTRNTLIRSEPW